MKQTSETLHLTMRIPVDILKEIDRLAGKAVTGRTRVIVAALRIGLKLPEKNVLKPERR